MQNVPPCQPLSDLLDEADRQRCALDTSDPRLNLLVKGLCYDSRRLEPGDAFFAYQGRSADGHAHIASAVDRGAALVVATKAVPQALVPVLVHSDPKSLMGKMARARYRDPASKMTLVALTGTNGKTTTAHLVASILAAHLGQAGLMGTLGAAVVREQKGAIEVGPYAEGAGLTTPEAPDALAQLAAWHSRNIQAAVMEASSIALCEGRLTELPADVSVLTNISHDHLDYHGSMQAYRQAKGTLFRCGTKRTGTRVLPQALAQDADFGGPGALLTYGVCSDGTAPADIEVGPHQNTGRPSALDVRTPRGHFVAHSPLFGRFNQENIAAAIAVAIALGVPDAAIQRGLSTMAAVPGRLQQVLPSAAVQAPGSASDLPLVLVDFAHTPDALQRVLDAVRPLRLGRVLLVVGCGGDRDPGKRPVMGQVAAQADAIWITSDNPRSEDPGAIAASMVTGLSCVPGAKERTAVQLDRAKAIAQAVHQAKANDVVLIAGKGHEPYQLIAGIKWPFDDRACAQAALDIWRPRESQP